jgi:cyclopropane fatty-acyl-phospholipid synthase-like methyltransferase
MLENISKFYDQSCENSKHGWQASRWQSEDDQFERFVASSASLHSNCSILDVGCGQGDFYEFIRSRYKGIEYKGIDVSEKMIIKAKEKHGNFENKDILNFNEKFDYVFALGTFNLCVENQYEYLIEHINKCFSCCKKAIAIALTSEASDIKYERPIYYYCPKKVLDLALQVSPYISINTAILPSEIILSIYK